MWQWQSILFLTDDSPLKWFDNQKMVDQKNTFHNWQTSGPRFPWRQLILGALVPITIFYALHRLGQPLTGAPSISWRHGKPGPDVSQLLNVFCWSAILWFYHQSSISEMRYHKNRKSGSFFYDFFDTIPRERRWASFFYWHDQGEMSIAWTFWYP